MEVGLTPRARRSYCGSVAKGNLESILSERVQALGLRREVPWRKLEILAEQLLRFGRAVNLSGATTIGALAEQICEALGVVALADRVGVQVGDRWIDVGSGGGLPGLVVGCCLPVSLTLVEPRARRAAFLDMMLGMLGIDGQVVRARLEPGGLVPPAQAAFRWATGRAVFAPELWLERARQVVERDGVVIVHLHVGGEAPRGEEPLAVVELGQWSLRGYRGMR